MIHKIALSKTIHLLGKILGLVIKEQEGSLIFNKIEKIRVLSKASRGNNSKKNINNSFKQLKSEIFKLSEKESFLVARSFGKFLDFSNIAESLFSIHNIHDHKIRKTQETNEIVILEEALIDVFKKNICQVTNSTMQYRSLKLILSLRLTQLK